MVVESQISDGGTSLSVGTASKKLFASKMRMKDKGLGALLATLLIAGVGNVKADKIGISNNGGVGVGSSVCYLAHQSGANELGGDGMDASWDLVPPNPYQPEMKIVTNPYGIELRKR